MSYQVYKNMKIAKSYNDDLKAGSTEDYLQDKIFDAIKMCFNGIYAVAKIRRDLFFNLKENWTLLKAHDYDAVLTNISNWLQKADDRYDGENWNEKHSNNTPAKYGDLNLHKKALEILTNEENDELVYNDDGIRCVWLHEFEIELDEEDCEIDFYTLHKTFDINFYLKGLHKVVIELLEENGINCKILKHGGIKVY